MHVPERGIIVPGNELFRGEPGYDPLDLVGDAPARSTQPLQFLVATTQEDWRGGRIDITEFVPPAPDVAMHFYQPIRPNKEGSRYGIADILATSVLAATVTYDESPDVPPRSGIYYSMPDPEGSMHYQLSDSKLVVGRPKVHSIPEPVLYPLGERTDTAHAADAFRVVDTTDQLAAIVDKFGWALGLNETDSGALAGHITNHVHGTRAYRRMQNLGEAIATLRATNTTTL